MAKGTCKIKTYFLVPSSDSLLSHVEQLLRAFILKISVCDAVLDHNPPGVPAFLALLPWAVPSSSPSLLLRTTYSRTPTRVPLT